MHELEAAIADLAAGQHGLVTRDQLTELGISKALPTRRCRAGHWRAVARGVFAIRGAPATRRQEVLAAQFAAGPDTLVSHRASVQLWRVRTVKRAPIEISIPRGRSFMQPGIIVHESRDLHLAKPETIDGIRVTGLARSLLDLGAVAPGLVRSSVWAARREHGIEWSELLGTLVAHGRQGRNGVGPLRVVVSQHYGEVAGDSATEDIAYALLADSPVLPRPDRQVPAVGADGVAVRADIGWPKYRALIEIDGVDHLTNEPVQHIDRHRRNQLELAGYRVLNFTGVLLRERPDQFVRDATALLAMAGCRLPGT